MELTQAEVSCSSTRETFSLHHLTDLHDGSPDHAQTELDERIKEISEDPKALWVGGGDYGDLILPGDKRFTPGVVSSEYREYMARIPDYFLERLEDRLAPIADKCVGLAAGNHEATIGKNYHRGVAAELAKRLGVVQHYLGDRGWTVLQFRKDKCMMPVSIYTYHGWSAGRLKGRKALQAERDIGAWNADVLLLGHDHQPYADVWWTEEVYHGRSGYRLRQRPRAVMNGGSWTYGQKPPSSKEEKLGWRASSAPGQSWVEGKNFRPQPPSNPKILIHVDFGHSKNGAHLEGRPASIAFEIRYLAETHYVGGVS